MDGKERKRATLFEDSVEDVVFCLLKKVKRPATGRRLLGDFFLMLSAKRGSHDRYFFELHDHFVFCKKDEKRSELAFMDILNAFLKTSEDTMIDGRPHFGLKFIKRKTYEELLTEERAVFEGWVAALKKFCVLTRFRAFYETRKVLGKGSFGKVFLVENRLSQREYAVKVFSKASFMADSFEKRSIVYEISMLRLMEHPRVIRLHELYEGENFVYCVCDLYKGSDLLNAIIKKGSQPEAKALTIVSQLLEALAYMHSLNIMHRDVKPENIIFKEGQEAIDIAVIDLGFATRRADYDKLFARCGTPGYVAPEVLADVPYDCRVDVFSAGVILYMTRANQPLGTRALSREERRGDHRQKRRLQNRLRLRQARPRLQQRKFVYQRSTY